VQIDEPAKDGEAKAALLDYISSVGPVSFWVFPFQPFLFFEFFFIWNAKLKFDLRILRFIGASFYYCKCWRLGVHLLVPDFCD
jgi:hypothetical protein